MKTTRKTQFAAVAAVTLSLALAGCAGGNTQAQSAATSADPAPAQSSPGETTQDSTPADTSQPPTQSGSSGLPENADLSSETPTITPEEAVATAQQEAGNGTLHGVGLDYHSSHNAWEYEVKIISGSTDYDIDIDAETGEVVKSDQGRTDDQDIAVDLSSPMTYDEALSLASPQGQGRLSGWTLESDGNRIEYQFDYEGQGEGVEVTVDANSKRVTTDD